MIDPDEIEPPEPTVGSASSDLEDDDKDEEIVGSIILPSFETRSGWERRIVRRERPTTERRPLGFRPPI